MESYKNNRIENIENKITKRSATEEDTDFARKAHHAAYHDVVVRQFGHFDEKEQDDFFDESWNKDPYEILLNNEEESGYCSIEYFPDHIFVHELVLLPEFQGKGIGSKVLKDIMDDARVKNIPIKLRVLKENRAQELYRKMGFEETETNDISIFMELRQN